MVQWQTKLSTNQLLAINMAVAGNSNSIANSKNKPLKNSLYKFHVIRIAAIERLLLKCGLKIDV